MQTDTMTATSAQTHVQSPAEHISSNPISLPKPLTAQMQQDVRHNWTLAEVNALYDMPFNDLMFKAQTVHRTHFDPNYVQVSTLLSIKTGACPEDCAYCPQSARYDTGLEKERLLEISKVIERAKEARATGSTRFCGGSVA
jgi:biotin synthase